MTTFGTSNTLKFKSDYNLSEHGVGLKLSGLRLANTILIVTKTKPIVEYGSSSSFLSIGLLSTHFIKDTQSTLLVAPIVSIEIKNKRIARHLTPQPEHFLGIIASYCKAKFDSGEALMQYGMNCMGEQGGTHIFMFDLKKVKSDKGNYENEVVSREGEIEINPRVFKEYE